MAYRPKGALWSCVSYELGIALIAAKVTGQPRAKLIVIDAADYESVRRFRWCVDKGYVRRGTKRDGRKVNLQLHREILGLTTGDKQIADHKDKDPLNCRRDNLRVLIGAAANGQNRYGKRTRMLPRGVGPNGKSFRAYATLNQKWHHLGTFQTIAAADAAAKAFRQRYMPYSYADANFAGKFACDVDCR